MIRYLFKQSRFFVFQIKMKNEKRNLSLNFNARLVWKSKNQLVLYFISQFQYRNENQNSISNRILICQKNYLPHRYIFFYTRIIYLPLHEKYLSHQSFSCELNTWSLQNTSYRLKREFTANSFFFATRLFEDKHHLVSKKSNLLVYIFVVNCRFFKTTLAEYAL